MTASVVTIVYVNDAPAAARFYGDLLGISPSFETPGYIAFGLGPGADLALWADQFESLTPDVPRTSEVCLAIDGGPEELDAVFQQWRSKGVTILHEPHDAGFGRTFLAADPDGNRVRVAPQD
ncbi:catechol 2,3-dioxygenase-like lactoylglutathione lyase family enzyme [Lipingzhangella halophila]|uniref:Catechol 2,3-dioxygenase-like lactoylglutathione lyase family enzyme n=1 Tax=Lipingzhangella halophila TaxID=1783352 RepID=A0A7W7RHZ4_9ACTN|nr:VOC family protein [Lipingzhangella halophila]MBB4932255.1 catechol 2,3-dioxygenase-like lactoylglutathione lyase family enzyme [Lipingzhangella halophila]